MIKLSAPEGPFSLIFNFKKHDIVLFGLPDDEDMQCDLKVFKEDVDISHQFDSTGKINPDTENLFMILNKINENDKPKKKGFIENLMNLRKK